MKKSIPFILVLLLTGFGCAKHNLPDNTLPTLSSDDDLAAMEAQRIAPDSEISHTVTNTEFTGYATPVGELVETFATTELNVNEQELVTHITEYIETFFNHQDEVYLNKTRHYECTIGLLGYDDQYAYTDVECVDPVGRAFSIPFRFEYSAAGNEIVDFKMLGNDTPVGIIFPEALAQAYYAQTQ